MRSATDSVQRINTGGVAKKIYVGPPEESYPTATPPTALEPPVAADTVQQGSARVVAKAAMIEAE
jgi:hypothetical protein